MNQIKLYLSNRDSGVLMIVCIIVFTFIFILIPLIFMIYLPQSLLGSYLLGNLYLFLITTLVLLYFIYFGVFIYYISIDSYVINISSVRPITSSVFSKKRSIDISHAMLYDYSFFRRPFTINTILMIKIITESNKVIAKRFTLSFLTHKNKNQLKVVLNKILLNNGERSTAG